MNRKKRTINGQNLQKKKIKPLTDNQAKVFESDKHLVLSGSAGSGKTFLCMNLALDDLLAGIYEKIVIVRSIVPTRDIGFLPGNVTEKCAQYEAPYKQIAIELFGRGDAYEILKQKAIVEFIPTSFIRGITLDNTVIIVDEAQNMTLHELDSIATRVGQNCRFMLCGNYKQTDLPKNGFNDFLRILRATREFDMIEFESKDIVRSGFVRTYIETKERLGM